MVFSYCFNKSLPKKRQPNFRYYVRWNHYCTTRPENTAGEVGKPISIYLPVGLLTISSCARSVQLIHPVSGLRHPLFWLASRCANYCNQVWLARQYIIRIFPAWGRLGWINTIRIKWTVDRKVINQCLDISLQWLYCYFFFQVLLECYWLFVFTNGQ